MSFIVFGLVFNAIISLMALALHSPLTPMMLLFYAFGLGCIVVGGIMYFYREANL